MIGPRQAARVPMAVLLAAAVLGGPSAVAGHAPDRGAPAACAGGPAQAVVTFPAR